MLHIQTIERVAGPVFGSIFGQTSDFFGVVPGMFPGGLGIVEWCSRAGLGVFRATFFDFFRTCSGRSPGMFPVLPDSF